MKKLFMLALIGTSMTAMSCSGNSENAAGSEDSAAVATEQTVAADNQASFPWNFPNGALNAQVGDRVLAVVDHPRHVAEGKDPHDNANYYERKLTEVGATESKVERCNDAIPNALIIPIPAGAQAKKGDILLTYNVKGSHDLQRAIVTDASNGKQPIVTFLDQAFNADEEKPRFGEKLMGTQLDEDGFIVLDKNALAPGAQIAIKDDNEQRTATVVGVAGDRVLAYSFAGVLEDAAKADVTIIPFNEDFKVGDAVWVALAGTYRPNFSVTKVDKENGLVWVKRNNSETINKLPIVNVTKVFQ